MVTLAHPHIHAWGTHLDTHTHTCCCGAHLHSSMPIFIKHDHGPPCRKPLVLLRFLCLCMMALALAAPPASSVTPKDLIIDLVNSVKGLLPGASRGHSTGFPQTWASSLKKFTYTGHITDMDLTRCRGKLVGFSLKSLCQSCCYSLRNFATCLVTSALPW